MLLQEIIDLSMGIWEKCYESHFVQELGRGDLPSDKFLNYMIQDSIYLKHYARIYGKAIYNAGSLREIQIYISLLEFLDEEQSGARLKYIKEAGLTDDDIELIQALPENKAYIDFMLEIAERGTNQEILMSVLPCILSYSYIFRRLVKENPEIEKTKYAEFICDYANDDYYEKNKKVITFVNDLCSESDVIEKETLKNIFLESSQHELAFWSMAYRSVMSEAGG